MPTIQIDPIYLFSALIAFIAWLIRLEAKVLAHEKKIVDDAKKEETKDKKDHEDRLTIWRKLDEIGLEQKQILKSLTRVETKIEFVTKE